jgi:CDGSH-type Zn-finger protein
MARIIRNEHTGPHKIEPHQFPRDEQGNLKPIWICLCGLSDKLPFCDGTHKTCKAEEPGQVYTYDPATKAVVDKKPG